MNKNSETIKQFLRFAIVGITNTLIAYVFNIGTLLIINDIGYRYDYIIANTVSFVLSVLWSFVWNNKYVFKSENNEKRHIGKALLKTYISYAFTGIVVNNFLLWIWVDNLGISKYIAPFFNPIITLSINFILSKFWVFRKSNSNKETGDNGERKI